MSTGPALIETLQICRTTCRAAGATYSRDADYLHHAIEAWKVRDHGRASPIRRCGQSTSARTSIPAHAADAVQADRSDEGRRRTQRPEKADRPERIGRGTTAFAVADADGNMIAVTQTLRTWGGTFYVSKGLGFLYNNHLRGGGGARLADSCR